ncbi:CotH kinase family protein [bacterium]|nr:CotH kinase family protein [bacterium]
MLRFILLIPLTAAADPAAGIDHWESVILNNFSWKYFIGKTEPGAGWKSLTFNDAAWKQGPGGIGYGDNDDNTVIEACVSLYLRRKFSILDTSRIESAILHMDYDDAFVAYINGVEIARAGISGNPPAHNRTADSDHEAQMPGGGLPSAFMLDKTRLRTCLTPGENLLAIQVHNTSASSSDLSSTAFLSVGINDASRSYRNTPGWFKAPFLFTSSNLPIILIETGNGSVIPDEPKIPARMKIIHNGTLNQVTDAANVYDGDIGIEIRGRYSASLPQKPYGIETRDGQGNNLNVSLLGLPVENDWILLANYNDKTFMRNSLAFHLFRAMGHWAPRTVHCEVMVNNDYQGIYVFCEKIKRDNDRVDIDELLPEENAGEDLTGGYIFKIDYYTPADSWVSAYTWTGEPGDDVHFVYEYPKPDEITAQQKAYLQKYVYDFETLMYGDYFDDPIDGFRSWINVGSFIDYLIIGELSRNVDAYKKSAFFFKDRDGKGGLLHAGPVWDFDWAWKNIDECYFREKDGSGWAYDVHQCGNWPIPPGWTLRLLEDPDFVRELNIRYYSLRETILSEAFINGYIDSVYAVVRDAQEHHYEKWPILGMAVGAPENDIQPATFAGEMTKLKGWIKTRLSWLDAHFDYSLAVEETEMKPACNFILDGNYPNPFNGLTNITYTLLTAGPVAVRIYDTLGKPVRTLVHGMHAEGSHSIVFDAEGLPSGVYFCSLESDNDCSASKKILLLR